MALTESYMLPLGSQAPDFKLPDVVTNKDRSLQELKGEKGSLVIFMCNHCPYVVHLMDAIVETAKIFSHKGIIFPSNLGDIFAPVIAIILSFLNLRVGPIN